MRVPIFVKRKKRYVLLGNCNEDKINLIFNEFKRIFGNIEFSESLLSIKYKKGNYYIIKLNRKCCFKFFFVVIILKIMYEHFRDLKIISCSGSIKKLKKIIKNDA